MPLWILQYGKISEIYDNITEANSCIKEFGQPTKLSVYVKDKKYTVDLENGSFLIEDEVIDKNDIKNPRYINFVKMRHIISGGKIIDTEMFINIGWQTTINGKNYQKIMVIKPNGEYEWVIK